MTTRQWTVRVGPRLVGRVEAADRTAGQRLARERFGPEAHVEAERPPRNEWLEFLAERRKRRGRP